MSIKKYTNGSWTPACRKYGTETDTITTLPVTIIGDGTPISSYTIKGNMEQNGTPTPSSPIYPSECGERTENLFDKDAITDGYAIAQDGTIIQNGNFGYTDYIQVTSGKSYIFSNLMTELNTWTLRIQGYNGDNWVEMIIERVIYPSTTQPVTFTIPSGVNALRISLGIHGRRQDINILMLNTGSTALPYEPYGYKLPITLGSATTDIYLGEVQSTRRVKKLVLTGEEGWRRTANEKCYYIDLANGCPDDYLKQVTTTSICSHYQSQNNTVSGSNEVDAGHFCFYIGGGFELYIGETTISSATDFKSYLQQQYANGTPVTVWYVLANPTTGIVNEPIRKIGDYVDSVSGTGLATSGTAQEFNINTTLKPSEADMTYHGWHEHEDTKYST